MAVIDGIPGLKVEIKMDGRVVKEFDDDDELVDPKTTTRYIEAISGANFEVHYHVSRKFPHSKDDLVCEVWVDNQFMRARFIYSEDMKQARGYRDFIEGICSENTDSHGRSAWTLERFTFLPLVITDEPLTADQQDLKAKIDTAGVISANFYRVVPKDSANGSANESFTPIGAIPEKAVKGRALSHQAGLGAPESLQSYELEVNDFDYLDDGEPVAIVNFKYRSLESLKSMCIVPRTPSPIPLEDRPEDQLTQEELRELLRRERARNAAAANVKREVKRERADDRESTTANDAEEVSFLEERPSKRRRATGCDDSGVEVIDLT